jgi:Ser-tRNA(Ala) deacylase AlaX
MQTMTERRYYDDAYITSIEATVTAVRSTSRARVVEVELSETPFYPQGGGQPSDQGEIVTANGVLKVALVRNVGTRVVHEGDLVGEMAFGDLAEATLKWPRRRKYMRVHGAGHLIHDVLMSMGLEISPLKGNHGDKAFLEYEGVIPPESQSELTERVMQGVDADLPIVTRETTRDELAEMGLAAPANLPEDKGLRIIQIGDFPPMPDGGVHVRSTGEIGNVVIHSITNDGRTSVVRYGVTGSG